MIIYKVVGAVFLILAALEGATLLKCSYEQEICTVEAYIELIRFIRTEVDIYALPIDVILKRCDAELLLRCGSDEDSFPKDLCELFARARIKDKTAERELSEFCFDFGKCYREEQLKRCDATLSVLLGVRETLRGELEGKKKMSYTLFLSSAVALIILLI